jgi:tetratricopeptide (TPR) repeat protein
MKRARTILCILAAVLAGANAGGQSLTVQYVEGSASQRNAGTWSALSIGDAVPLSASVKVERLGLVQLRAPGSSITLTQPGTYSIKDVVAASAALRSAGAVEAAAVSFARVLSGRGTMVNAVGGVRSEMAPPLGGEPDTGGVSGSSFDSVEAAPSEPAPEPDPAHAAMDRARDLIASGQYQEAITALQDAIPQASESEAREASFYLASAFELNGDARSALVALKAANPKGTDDWAPDSILLGARLLEDTFAWAQARDLLVRAGTTIAIDQERAATYYFLLALAYRGTGEAAREKAALDNVVALDPGSDLALAAERLR